MQHSDKAAFDAFLSCQLHACHILWSYVTCQYAERYIVFKVVTTPNLCPSSWCMGTVHPYAQQLFMLLLQELATGRTSVFVAHRLSTVQRCDKIIVLSNGMVAEQGTHEELMAARRIYYDMWEVQKAADAEAEKVLESLSSFSSYDDPDTTGSNLQSGNGKHTGRELQTSQP